MAWGSPVALSFTPSRSLRSMRPRSVISAVLWLVVRYRPLNQAENKEASSPPCPAALSHAENISVYLFGQRVRIQSHDKLLGGPHVRSLGDPILIPLLADQWLRDFVVLLHSHPGCLQIRPGGRQAPCHQIEPWLTALIRLVYTR